MSRARWIGTLAGLVVVGVLLAVWAAREARDQRRETEEALRAEVTTLAQALGPALAAAGAAVSELEEIVGWKLLDNARLLARLDHAGSLGEGELSELRDANGLDSVVFVDEAGSVLRFAGDPSALSLVTDDVAAVADGRASEAILGWSLDNENQEHVGAAASLPLGGAVVVTTHASTAFAYARRLGVANLLEQIVDTGRVLYLEFDEEPGGRIATVSWDRGPVPPRDDRTGRISELRGQSVFEIDVPVELAAGRTGTLRVGLDARPLQRASTAAIRRTALVGLVLAAFGLAGTSYAVVARERALERVRNLRRLAEIEDRRRREERLAAAGALAAGLAHEIRNPLNAISIAAQRLERRPELRESCHDFAVTIRTEVDRLEEILKGFLDLARPSFGERVEVDLHELIASVVELLGIEAAARRVTLAHDRGAAATLVIADGAALRRAVVNLVRNAIEASHPGGTVEIRVEREGDLARVRVLDAGRGIAPEKIEAAFDAFFTTRAEGTGLGLPLVRRVATDHGGWARIQNRPGGGVEAILEIHTAGRTEGGP